MRPGCAVLELRVRATPTGRAVAPPPHLFLVRSCPAQLLQQSAQLLQLNRQRRHCWRLLLRRLVVVLLLHVVHVGGGGRQCSVSRHRMAGKRAGRAIGAAVAEGGARLGGDARRRRRAVPPSPLPLQVLLPLHRRLPDCRLALARALQLRQQHVLGDGGFSF